MGWVCGPWAGTCLGSWEVEVKVWASLAAHEAPSDGVQKLAPCSCRTDVR